MGRGGKAIMVVRNLTCTPLAATAGAPRVIASTPTPGSQSGGRHCCRSPPFMSSSPDPKALRVRVRRPQNDRYDIFRRAAAQARIPLAADPHDVGGRIGGLCVLHAWTRTLPYHPHGPCLVPAGGVSADRTEWRPARPTWCPSMLSRSAFVVYCRHWYIRNGLT
jgi:hypothetical protein